MKKSLAICATNTAAVIGIVTAVILTRTKLYGDFVTYALNGQRLRVHVYTFPTNAHFQVSFAELKNLERHLSEGVNEAKGPEARELSAELLRSVRAYRSGFDHTFPDWPFVICYVRGFWSDQPLDRSSYAVMASTLPTLRSSSERKHRFQVMNSVKSVDC